MHTHTKKLEETQMIGWPLSNKAAFNYWGYLLIWLRRAPISTKSGPWAQHCSAPPDENERTKCATVSVATTLGAVTLTTPCLPGTLIPSTVFVINIGFYNNLHYIFLGDIDFVGSSIYPPLLSCYSYLFLFHRFYFSKWLFTRCPKECFGLLYVRSSQLSF